MIILRDVTKKIGGERTVTRARGRIVSFLAWLLGIEKCLDHYTVLFFIQ